MSQQQTKSAAAQPNKASVLPQQPGPALEVMLKITENMIELSERETQALVHGDMLAFAILQDEKQVMANNYTEASEEFRRRMAQFRGQDKTLIDKLEKAQIRLGEKAKSNNKIVEKMKTGAQEKTKNHLFAVQEIAQQHHVVFEDQKFKDQKSAASS